MEFDNKTKKFSFFLEMVDGREDVDINKELDEKSRFLVVGWVVQAFVRNPIVSRIGHFCPNLSSVVPSSVRFNSTFHGEPSRKKIVESCQHVAC
jgi:hypothetical protein